MVVSPWRALLPAMPALLVTCLGAIWLASAGTMAATPKPSAGGSAAGAPPPVPTGPWHGSALPDLGSPTQWPEYTTVFQNGECDAGDSYGAVPGIALHKKCYGCFRIPALARNPVTGVLHAFVEARRSTNAQQLGVGCEDLPDTHLAWKKSVSMLPHRNTQLHSCVVLCCYRRRTAATAAADNDAGGAGGGIVLSPPTVTRLRLPRSITASHGQRFRSWRARTTSRAPSPPR